MHQKLHMIGRGLTMDQITSERHHKFVVFDDDVSYIRAYYAYSVLYPIPEYESNICSMEFAMKQYK